jgi:hypothetical protein
MVQSRKHVRLTKPKVPLFPPSAVSGSPMVEQPNLGSANPESPSNKLHIQINPISKLFTDDTGRFLVRSQSGNQYIMVAYHCDSNTILAVPFKNRADKHCLIAYNSIMKCLKDCKLLVNLQVLDNKASKTYKQTITSDWGMKFQLVPPLIHRRNIAKHTICTFKAHFLSILARVAEDFPKH